MNYFAVLFILFFSINALAQDNKVNINWHNNNKVANSSESNIQLSHLDPNYFMFNPNSGSLRYMQFLSSNTEKVELVNVESVRVSANLLDSIEDIAQDVEYDVAWARHSRSKKLVINLNPFFFKNNVAHRIVSFEFETSSSPQQTSASKAMTPIKSSNGIYNSMFSSGDIFKFYVENTGVHKLDFTFLRRLGVDESSIPSSSLKIYGHGGEMLPLVNQDTQYFDPPELSIQVVDGGDGRFNEGDFILFYGSNTKGWNEESETFQNLYANRSYYYLKVDTSDGQRMQELSQPTGSATTIITEFDDEQFYEVDETSLSLVGRKWFGDRFDIETERTYEFTFPNLVQSAPVELRVDVGAISPLASSFSLAFNGQDDNNLITIFGAGDNAPSRGASLTSEYFSNTDEINIQLTYNKNGNPGARGFLDFLWLKAKRRLIADENQFSFKNNDAALQSGIGEYQIENTESITQIWDITDPIRPQFIPVDTETSVFSFKAQLGELKEYQVVTANYFSPQIEPGNFSVANVNLKGTILTNAQGQFQDIDYLIITSSSFMAAANRLAQYRRDEDGLIVKTVAVEDIYEEFNSGKQDIAAIRNFIKYIYDNASSPENRIQFLGIIGDASVDYKDRLQNNTNIVPTYQSLGSFSTTVSSFMSDDFFTMMDPAEGNMSFNNSMDLAVGRMLADTPQKAMQVVNKIISTEQSDAYAQWRNNFVLISDDANTVSDYFNQVRLDELGDEISANRPSVNVKKIHSDAFQQVTSAGGARYPEVNVAITDAIEVGASVVNYFGHGGEDGLAQERIVTQTNAQEWRNPNRLTCFVTVTCEFTKFDNPLRMTGGELTFWNENGGAASLVTTTRAITVTAGVNFNQAFAPFLFDYENNNETIAQSVVRAKRSIAGNGKRIVFFIGDPAMKLPLPKPGVKLTSIDDVPISEYQDTLNGLGKYKFKGQIVDANNQRIQNYNGKLSAVVFDKRIERQTLGNDGTRVNGELAILDFTTLGENLFRGKASVENGEFEFEFVLPKDTRLPVDAGRVSFYSSRTGVLEDYNGFNNEILIGGINENAPEDNEGPIIELFMNDESFVNGGITDNQPFILAQLEDQNGINTAGGIGHDIIAILDGDEANPIVLNEYYEAEENDFTKGSVNYRLRDLEEGEHTLTFKAWDVYNNSSTQDIQFTVTSQDDLKITRVLNYPNPFIDYTEFWFNHNRPFEPLEVMVQVFTVSGKLVWTKNQIANTSGFLFRDMSWNGRDDFGDKIGKGVYVYKLTVKSTLTQQKVEKYEKLVIL